MAQFQYEKTTMLPAYILFLLKNYMSTIYFVIEQRICFPLYFSFLMITLHGIIHFYKNTFMKKEKINNQGNNLLFYSSLYYKPNTIPFWETVLLVEKRAVWLHVSSLHLSQKIPTFVFPVAFSATLLKSSLTFKSQ